MSDDPILAALSRLEAGQTHMVADVTQVRADLTHMAAELTRVRAEAADFRDQVLNRLTAIREDIGVNMARVDRVAETVTDLRAELVSLRGENAALWRMIKAIESRVDQIESR
jgi:cell division protein FtsB